MDLHRLAAEARHQVALEQATTAGQEQAAADQLEAVKERLSQARAELLRLGKLAAAHLGASGIPCEDSPLGRGWRVTPQSPDHANGEVFLFLRPDGQVVHVDHEPVQDGGGYFQTNLGSSPQHDESCWGIVYAPHCVDFYGPYDLSRPLGADYLLRGEEAMAGDILAFLGRYQLLDTLDLNALEPHS